MPASKKVRTESAQAPLPPVVWQRLGDDGKLWTEVPAADASVLETAFKTGLPMVAIATMSWAPGTSFNYDFGKFTETGPDGAVRPVRRLTPGVWEWKDDTGVFVAFYDEDNVMIEQAWRAMSPAEPEAKFSTTKLSFNAGFNSQYTFSLQTAPKAGELKGTQLNEDSGTARELRRSTADVAMAVWDTKDFGIAAKKPLADVVPTADDGTPAADSLARGMSFASGIMAPPDTWEPQTQPLQYFDVKEGSAEFKAVTAPFQKKLNCKSTIISVRRIQNEPLWRFYALTRYRVAQRNKGDAHEQEQLYHGCRVRQNLDSIIEYGFDMRVARDGLAGLGIYFALSSSYSNCGYVLQNPDKSKEMLVCRVAVGSHTQGKHGMKRPPPKKGSTGELYDSVSRLPQMYVVFDNSQAYPEYLIKYRH
jgi:hypothetical protein